MINEFKLSELLNSRFCHDLAGPIGAISNGLEFLSSDNEEIKKKALHILELGSEQALLRLQFYRQIYGYNKPNTNTSLDQIKDTTIKYLESNKIPLNWNLTDESIDKEINAIHTKIIGNLINIASLTIIKKGNINFTIKKVTNSIVANITASGEFIKFDQEAEKTLTTGIDESQLSTINIHLYYCHRLIISSNSTLNIKNDHNLITFNLIFNSM